MKILLDECLPLDFRHSFPTHDAHTVQWAGLKGRKNGELLRAAEVAGYDVPLTVDQGSTLLAALRGPQALNHSGPLPNQSNRRSIALRGCHHSGTGDNPARPDRRGSIIHHGRVGH